MSGWTLAVDFGTCFTSAAIRDGGSAPSVVLVGSHARFPSMVAAHEDGHLVVGKPATNAAVLRPDRVSRTPKRHLGEDTLLLGGRPVAVVDAVAAVLDRVAGEARRQRGGTSPDRVVMTHPARWAAGGPRWLALAEAASRAGLVDPIFVSEPVAAAAAFPAGAISEGGGVAVYDLGGGTFDTAVLRRSSGGFDVAGPLGGDPDLGGEDLDAALFDHLGSLLDRLDPQVWASIADPPDSRWRAARAQLFEQAREAKETLSDEARAEIHVAELDRSLAVSRGDFEGLVEADLAVTVDLLAATIGDADLGGGSLEALYLVGGASQIPLLYRLLHQRFGIAPSLWGDPKNTIVLGAAMWEERQAQARPAAQAPRPAPAPEPPPPVEHVVLGEASSAKASGPWIYVLRDTDGGAQFVTYHMPTSRVGPDRPVGEALAGRPIAMEASSGGALLWSSDRWQLFAPDGEPTRAGGLSSRPAHVVNAAMTAGAAWLLCSRGETKVFAEAGKGGARQGTARELSLLRVNLASGSESSWEIGEDVTWDLSDRELLGNKLTPLDVDGRHGVALIQHRFGFTQAVHIFGDTAEVGDVTGHGNQGRMFSTDLVQVLLAASPGQAPVVLTAEVGQLATVPITLGERPRLGELTGRKRVRKLKRGPQDRGAWLPTAHGIFAAVQTGSATELHRYISANGSVGPALTGLEQFPGAIAWWSRAVPGTTRPSLQRPVCVDGPDGFWLQGETAGQSQLIVHVHPTGRIAGSVARRGVSRCQPLAADGTSLYLHEVAAGEEHGRIIRLPVAAGGR